VTYGIDFTPQPPVRWWQTALAWLVLIALFFGFLRYCVQPVTKPIGEAMLRQLEENKK
jgi:hypothetical protein